MDPDSVRTVGIGWGTLSLINAGLAPIQRQIRAWLVARLFTAGTHCDLFDRSSATRIRITLRRSGGRQSRDRFTHAYRAGMTTSVSMVERSCHLPWARRCGSSPRSRCRCST